MKKILLFVLILVFIINVFAVPSVELREKIWKESTIPFDQKIDIKDSDAQSSGMIGILEGKDLRGFAPPMLKNIVVSEDGYYCGVFASHFNGFAFDNIFYSKTSNFGSIWSAPTSLINSDFSNSTRIYGEMELTGNQDLYIVYSCADIYGNYGVYFMKDTSIMYTKLTYPMFLSDTTKYDFSPSITSNHLGDSCLILSLDVLENKFLLKRSFDSGVNWEQDISYTGLDYDTISEISVFNIRYGNGLTYITTQTSWKNEIRSDLVGSGKGTSFSFAFSQSDDFGFNWNGFNGVFNGDIWPEISSINGDTILYFLDTTNNSSNDPVVVKAFLDENEGNWKNQFGDTLAFGFGTWWYWWDAQYYPEENRIFYALPVADLFVDYYLNNDNDLSTFIHQGRSLIFGMKDDTSKNFKYVYVDLHDKNILDSTGLTPTNRGYCYSANLTYDPYTEEIYVVYLDYLTSKTSVEMLRFASDKNIYRATVIPNANLISVECSKYIVDNDGINGFLHISGVAGSLDSVYWKIINVFDPSFVWDSVGYWGSFYGIGNKNKVNNCLSIKLLSNILKEENSLKLLVEEEGIYDIKIFDKAGRVFYSKSIFLKKGVNLVKCDIKNGVNFISVRKENRTFNVKFLKI
ncbi:MAG: hypothetical protein ABIN39_06290 [candidate division WOR-3 bacterium]